MGKASAWRTSNPLCPLCAHQISTFAQLKMCPLDNWKAWMLCQAFSDLKPSGRPWTRGGIKKKIQPSCAHSYMIQTSATEIFFTGRSRFSDIQYRTYTCIGWYFCTDLHTSLHKCPVAVRHKHTHETWVTHHKHIKLGKSLVTTLAPEGPDSPAAVIAVKRQH